MWFGVITLFPEMFAALRDFGMPPGPSVRDWSGLKPGTPATLPKTIIAVSMSAPMAAVPAW